jgi:hypothetical protein
MTTENNTNKLKPLKWEDAIENGIVGKSGKLYKLDSEVSFANYAKFQEYMEDVYSGMDAAGRADVVNKAYAALNAGKVADAAVHLHRYTEAAKLMTDKYTAAQKAVAILFNHDEVTLEDRKVFNETRMLDKVKDWEDYGVSGFFMLLANITVGSKVVSPRNSQKKS